MHSTDSDVMIPEIETHTVERLDPAAKVQLYMQASKVKIQTHRPKRNQQLDFGMIQTKTT